MSENNHLRKDLTVGSVRQQLLRFAWPIILANLLQTVYSLVDMVIVGQFVGSAGLSAVGIGSMITSLFLNIGMCMGSAGQTLIAQQIGAKDHDGLNSTIGTLFSLLAIAGAVFGLLCAAGAQPLMRLLNTPAEAFSAARWYTVICGVGMLFIYGYNAVSSMLRGMGESRLPLVIIAAASTINLILDLLFVVGFRWGAPGAAAATVLAQAASFLAAVRWLYQRRESFGFDFRLQSFRIRERRLMTILRLAVPYVVQGLAISLSMTIINARVNSYGVTASAVDSIGQRIDNMLYIVTGALAVASAAMIGQSFGARDHRRIEEIHNSCLMICLLVFVIVSVILLTFPVPIFRLFSGDAGVLAMAPAFMRITVLFFFAASTMVPPFSLIEGIGYAWLGLFTGLMDGVVARIGLSLLLEHFFGLYGLWTGNAAAGLATTIIAAVYYYSKRWKRRSVLI